MRLLYLLAATAAVAASLLLASCGGGSGDRITAPPSLEEAAPPPQLKRIVIGTSEHRQTLRESLRRPSKPLPPTLSYWQSRNGQPIASDAPSPYIESAGMVLVHAHAKGMVQVAYHEDRLGRVARDVPHRFEVSDTSIVAAAEHDREHPNAVLLTLTGRRGNAYVTALDAAGNAMSKFMVLSATPRDDVAVIDDPDIRPVLCPIIFIDGHNACDLNASTDFIEGGMTGPKFSADDFLKGLAPLTAAVVFDAASLERLRPYMASGKKNAIYFEALDVLMVMDPSYQQQTALVTLASDRKTVAPAQYMAYWIDHMATQKEFNTYLDYGGQLSSSPLTAPGVTDHAQFEITPDKPAQAVLTAIELTDGTRLSASAGTLSALTQQHGAAIRNQVYELRQQGPAGMVGTGLECRTVVTAGRLLNHGFTTFKSLVSAELGGNFLWSDGHPTMSVDVNPMVDAGGQLKFGLEGSVALECKVPIYERKLRELGVPILGNVKVVVPLSFKVELGVEGAGDLVLVLPRYNVSDPSNLSAPGKAGLRYAADSGFNSDFNIKATLAKDELGIAEGTTLKDAVAGSVGLKYRAGLGFDLALRATVKAWPFKGEVDATVFDGVAGVGLDAAYHIDTAKQTSQRVTSDGKAGVGIFANFRPSVTVKTNWFNLNFNLFSVGDIPPLWLYRLKYTAGTEQKFEPAETAGTLRFRDCLLGEISCNDSPFASLSALPYVNSSQQFLMKRPVDQELLQVHKYSYRYAVRDKDSGRIVVTRIPLVDLGDTLDNLQLRALKYGATNVLWESVTSEPFHKGGGTTQYCYFWSNGDPSQVPLADQRCSTE
jgi:hypothetical protein